MKAALNIVTNPFNPNLDRVQKVITSKSKISTLVKKHKVDLTKPVICYVNDGPLLRKDWDSYTVKDNDIVSFITLPQGGGGGSSPLRLVAQIALMYYAPGISDSLFGFKVGTFANTLVSAGISFVGTALVNALIPPPQLPKAQVQAQLAAPSPTYSLSAQGNQARIGQAIPVLYGRMKVFPDFAAQPYAEFIDNDQYLYQLFVITQGKALINANEIYIEDTPISSFSQGEFALEILQPGQRSELFPSAVYNTAEISGQEPEGATSVGPFIVNPSLTQIGKISFDVACPRGLYYANDEGKLDSRSVVLAFYIRKVNDIGVPDGAEILVGTETITGATQTAIRKTYTYTIQPGRYQARVARTNGKSNDARTANDVNVVSIRGYSTERIDYGNVTMMAIRAKATNNLSQQSSRRISCIAERQLQIPSYNPTTKVYTWSAEQTTRSIAWAIADMCRAPYGAQVVDSRINLAQLMALDTLWQSRGDELNGMFDSTQSFWEALSLACRAGRARPYIQGGLLNFVRDSPQSLPTAMFTSRNIVKGSFKLSYMTNSDDTSDCVDVSYFDETVWKPRIVRAALDAGRTFKPALVKSWGITNRNQAFREGMASSASNRYRRKEISFETELEGYIPSIGDLIAIQSDIPKWGQSAEVIEVSGNTVTTTEELKWTPNEVHYVLLRKTDGSATAPLEVEQGALPTQFVFKEPNTFIFQTELTKERTHVAFGRANNFVQLAKVLTITPRGKTVAITAINENALVYSADGTTVPPDLYNYGVQAPASRPILSDFTVTQTGSGVNPSVTVTWPIAVGASRYIIEKSTDGNNWESLAEVTLNSFSFLGAVGDLYIRVAAVGALVGPYVTKMIQIGLVPPPGNVTGGSISLNGMSYDVSWTTIVDADEYYVEISAVGTVRRSFRTITNSFSYTLENAVSDGGPWRTITVKIWARKGQVLSLQPLTLIGTNEAPAAPTIIVTPGYKSNAITVSPCTERDYAGTKIHASTDPSFTPSSANLIWTGVGNFYLHNEITGQLYYKAAHYDTYGDTGLNYSATVSSVAIDNIGGIEIAETQLPTVGNFDGRIVYLRTTYTDATSGITYQGDRLYLYKGDTGMWVTGDGGLPGPGTITNEMLAGNILANKISVANLAAISANTGNLTAQQITIDNTGAIKGGMTAYGVGSGFFMGYDGGAYKLGIGTFNAGTLVNGFTYDGIKTQFSGELRGASGVFSGALQVSSAPFGKRLTIDDDQIKVYDANNKIRVLIGRLR